MSGVRSFYLSGDVIALVESFPRNERSRTVNNLLRQYLRRPQESRQQVDEARIRRIVMEMVQGLQVDMPLHESGAAIAEQSLSAVLGMREA